MRRTALAVLALAALSLTGLVGCAKPDQHAVAACAALARTPVDQGKITEAKFFPGGFKPQLKTLLVGIAGIDVPDSCRVTLMLKPTTQSHIKVEIWMPAKGWNNRFQGVANGGLAGSVDELSMSIALAHGYAVAGTDTGHESPKDTDGEWALNQPELIKDFGWRAVHLTAVTGKAIVAAYYGRPAAHAYFIGGSNGGREGLMEAQRYPEDYDGIVSGAPSLDGGDNLMVMTWIQQQMMKTPGAFIYKNKLAAIHAAVLKACDGLDGVKDGLIEDPRQCRFDPQVLLCHGAETDQCLTPPQVASLRDFYSGPGGGTPGDLDYAYEPGGEMGWAKWGVGDGPRKNTAYDFAIAFHRNLIYSDATWSLDKFDIDKDRVAVAKTLGVDYDARDPDLTRFKAHGGKLIIFHGWSDQALPPRATVAYYDSVIAKMGAPAVQDFARLYMAPGMEHVIGGDGPNIFGQATVGTRPDPHESLYAAMEQWVENGVAPGPIVATKYDNDFKPLVTTKGVKVLRTRLLCPYPQVERWKGSGDTNAAANFTCVAAAG